jgi:hypothetical protein
MDPLSEYREKQRLRHEKETRKIYIENKYKDLIILDKITRSIYRIKYFIKKYVFRETINHIYDIPGLFRKRLAIRKINLYDHMMQEAIEIEKMNKFTEAIEELTAGIVEEEEYMRETIIESYKFINEATDKDDILYWIQIDLNIYGPYPEIPFYIDKYQHTLYFTKEQQNTLKLLWDQIDPTSVNGLRYQQMLDSTKALVELYNHMNIEINNNIKSKIEDPILDNIDKNYYKNQRILKYSKK